MSQTHKQVLEQAIELLSSLSAKDYQLQVNAEFSSSIGIHIRHVIDHFMAIVDGHETGLINYNKRQRFSPAEKTPSVAIALIEEIIEWLGNLEEASGRSSVTVISDLHFKASTENECQSTLERELIFVSSHAIHHFALIRIICQSLNKQIPEFFGYAPATISNINKSA